MGMFSYDCSNCGSHDQFDWVEDCIVTVKNKIDGEIYYVKGDYDGYGRVLVSDENHNLHNIYLLQFEQYFESWALGGDHSSPKINVSIVAKDIYCNGKNLDNLNKICIKEQLLRQILDYIPVANINKLQKWE